MIIATTDTPAKTPRPIGRTWSVLPGGTKEVGVGVVSAAAPTAVPSGDELELGIRVSLPEGDGEGWLRIDKPPDRVGDGLEEPCET